MYINALMKYSYIKATCFGRKSAIIRQRQRIYEVQYKRALFTVNDMGSSHSVQAYIVPCLCSALAWWWLFYGRNM